MAKYRLAMIGYDFYGDEYTNFVSHLSVFVKHKVVSACAIKQCPAKNLYVEEHTIPSVLMKSRECFIQFLKDWLFSSWSASCKRSLSEPVTDGEHIYWKYNNVWPSATLSHPKLLNFIVVDSETNRHNFAITANCIVVGNEINRLNFATVLNETAKLTAQAKFQEPGPVANTINS